MLKKLIRVKARRYIAKHLSKFIYYIYILKFKCINFSKKPPIIILTPGKVGSSSVYYTLKNKMNSNSFFHIHFLSKDGINNSKIKHLNSDRKSIPLHLINSDLLAKKLKNYNGDLKIITIIREPISRSISSFFQNIDFYKNSIENHDLKIDELKAMEIIKKNIYTSINDIEDWFAQEIKYNFNINIKSEKSFLKKGFRCYQNNNTQLLLMRMEDLDSFFEIATQDFFKLKSGIKLKKYNIGNSKYYSKQYKNIKSQIKLEKKDIVKIVSSNYFKEFYFDKTKETVKKYS
tara:strand:+ start:565 stop:1431 length:867 start_codon:yes stop_codon:yes gene_type:complete